MDPGAPSPGRSVQIKPLDLTDSEMADLVEFLKTLTGASLDPALTTKPAPSDGGTAPVDAGAPPADAAGGADGGDGGP
jgi:hypothetical protein